MRTVTVVKTTQRLESTLVKPAPAAVRAAVALVLLSCCVLSAWRAEATPEYPDALDRALTSLDPASPVQCERPLSRCLICHTTALGGRTANQPFINTLRDRYGFDSPSDSEGLEDAVLSLAQDDADGDGVSDVDSDGDGVSDIDELSACNNPSGPEYGAPEYGCDGAMLIPVEHGVSNAWCAVLAALLGLFAARRLRV